MGTTRWIRLAFGMFLLFLPFLIFVVSCYPGEQPSWYQKYEELESLNENVDSPRWRQLAGEILQESAKGMPPAKRQSWSQRVCERFFFWFPLQDSGETTTYGDILRELASAYVKHGDLDMAEDLLRRAVELETADHLLHPLATIRVNRTDLIDLLLRRGKLSEAIALQDVKVKDCQIEASKYAKDQNLQTTLLMEEAKLFEMQKKFPEAENCLKKLIFSQKEEVAEYNLTRVKKENEKAPKGVSYSLNTYRWLDLLSEFYARRRNYDLQEAVLLRKLSLQEATFPENDARMAKNYENMATNYFKYENYERATRFLLKSLRCQESEERWKRISLIYKKQKRYDAAIKAMARCVELNEKSETAANRIKMLIIYSEYAKLLDEAGKTEQAKIYQQKAKVLQPTS